MARYQNIVDLLFSESGDFVLGENGDLADTRSRAYRGFIQMVLNRIMSSKGDWPLHPDIGVGLNAFVGKPNTKVIADRIKQKIVSELSKDDLIRGNELIVDIFPVSSNAIAIGVIVSPPGSGRQINLVFTYDMRDNKLIPRNVRSS
jgi:hypothetical protein